jgi:hypothetical protein
LSHSDSSDDEYFSAGRSSDDDGSGGSDSSENENHFGSPSLAMKISGGLKKVGAAKQPAKSLSKSVTMNNRWWRVNSSHCGIHAGEFPCCISGWVHCDEKFIVFPIAVH